MAHSRWVGTRRVALRYVFSSPRLAPCVRLSPHTAQHLWSFSMDTHEASVPISPAPQYIPRGQLARSLGTFVPIFPKARGLRRQSSSWCTWLSHVQTTMPHPTLLAGLGVSLGSPLPTAHSPSHPSSSLPCSAWKTQTERCRWRVSLLAPSALCGSPGFAQRVEQVDLCDDGNQFPAIAV